MAGSWNHSIADGGKLLRPEDFRQMLEPNTGDVWEYAEEAYGMVWYLAYHLAESQGEAPERWIEEARAHYKDGLTHSPGTDGRLPEGDD